MGKGVPRLPSRRGKGGFRHYKPQCAPRGRRHFGRCWATRTPQEEWRGEGTEALRGELVTEGEVPKGWAGARPPEPSALRELL